MKRFVLLAMLAMAVIVALVPAQAGSPHFVQSPTVTRVGNTLSVTGKEAGLGNEAQVHIVLSATAECINPGQHHPKAANKTSVSAAGNFPVQNGKADFSLTLTATFKPDCTPPMTVVFTDVTLMDTTNNISANINGTF